MFKSMVDLYIFAHCTDCDYFLCSSVLLKYIFHYIPCFIVKQPSERKAWEEFYCTGKTVVNNNNKDLTLTTES